MISIFNNHKLFWYISCLHIFQNLLVRYRTGHIKEISFRFHKSKTEKKTKISKPLFRVSLM